MEKKLISNVEQTKKGILITLSSGEEFLLSANAYSDGFYYPDKELSKDEFLLLKKNDKNKKAGDYLASLLSHNRYTYHQIFQKVSGKFSLSKSDIESLLKPYVDAEIIDDFAYAKDYIESKSELGYGKNYLEAQLLQRGVPERILKQEEIRSLYQQSQDILPDLLAKVDKTKQNLTIEERKEKIYALLLRRGYSTTEAKSAIENFYSHFSDQQNEEEALRRQSLLGKEAEKCYNSLAHKKGEAAQKRNAFNRKLLSKGFTYAEIEQIISEKEYSFHD